MFHFLLRNADRGIGMPPMDDRGQYRGRERLSRDLPGRDGSHRSFLLDSGASSLGENRWERIGRYRWGLTPTDGYSRLNRYLIGVRFPGEVPALRLLREVRDPSPRPGKAFWDAFVLLLQRHEALLGRGPAS